MSRINDEEFDDGLKDDVTSLNIRKIPDKKTAVALKGSEGGKKVPTLAAAGRGHIAEKILKLAYENGINVREDRELAELLACIELDSPIPGEAFRAVGEILYYVYNINEQKNPFDSVIEDGNSSD